MNDFYNDSAVPATNAQLSSATMRAEFQLIEAGFDKLPSMSGKGGRAVRVNAGATALEAGPVALTGTDGTTLNINAVATLNSDTYTPTLTNTLNISSSTSAECQWMRVGNVVTVSGLVSVQSSGSGTILLEISLPVASNLANAREAVGTCVFQASDVGWITGDATNNRVTAQVVASSGATSSLAFHFTYRVI